MKWSGLVAMANRRQAPTSGRTEAAPAQECCCLTGGYRTTGAAGIKAWAAAVAGEDCADAEEDRRGEVVTAAGREVEEAAGGAITEVPELAAVSGAALSKKIKEMSNPAVVR